MSSDKPISKKKSKSNFESEEQKPAEKEAENFELEAFKDSNGAHDWTNRQRTLILCSRGVNQSQRHLMNDLIDLIPHSKKEPKLDRKIAKDIIDDLCF